VVVTLEMFLPTCLTMPNSVILRQTVQALIMEIRQKILTPRARPLKVIGTNTDRSATYDFL